MRRNNALFLTPLFLLGACGTTTVFDDWSCDTPTGSCSTVAEVDAKATAAATDSLRALPPQVERKAGGFKPPQEPPAAPSPSDVTPMRTPDVTARIVFAPFTDHDGLFHGRSVIHAVMEDGQWIAPTDDDGDATNAP